MRKRLDLPPNQDVLRTDEEYEDPAPEQTPLPPDDSVSWPEQTPFPPDECEVPEPEPTPTPTEEPVPEPEPTQATLEEVATSVNAEVLGLIDQCTQALAVTESQDMSNASKCLSNASEWLVRASTPATPPEAR